MPQPSPSEIGIWWMVFAFIVSVITNIFTVVSGFRSQRRQVSLQENVATLPQLQKVENDLNKLKESIVLNGETRRQNIEAKVESVRKELKEDIQKTSAEVKELSREVGGLSNNCEMTNASVNNLSAKIDRLIERKAEEHRIGL